MDVTPTILAQLVPAAAAETTLYAVPQTEKASLSELVVCNESGSPARFRVSISLLSAPTVAADYLFYDLLILGNDTFAAELTLTIPPLAVMRVYASSASLAFNLFGAKA